MALVTISRVRPAQEIIDSALKAGRQVSVRTRPDDDRLTKKRKKERERLIAIAQSFQEQLKVLSKSFPSYDELNEFYRELFANDIDPIKYKQILSRAQNASRVIQKILRSTRGRLEAASSIDEAQNAVNAAIGRWCSVVDDLHDDLVWLEAARKIITNYPVIKEIPTVCFAGFPNVGKTTLFAELTGSQAEVNSYAFTTKQLNVGYMKSGYDKIQFVDTPGTLNRDHMNAIERQADLALKYVANLIVFVFDPTEQYSKSDQEALLKTMKQYNAEVVSYVSKTDLVTDKQLADFVGDKQIVSKKEVLKKIHDLV